jgi:D-galactarolactone cycloisomerase
MKIAKAESILLSMPFEAGGTPPWSFGGRPANSFDVLLVRLETDNGLVGWGEAFSRGRDVALKQLIDTRLLPLLIGRDATQISRTKHDLEFQLHNFGRIGAVEYGIAAIDIALWDLLGKSCGKPLHVLLGGAYADALEVYASLMRYRNVPDVRKATQRAVERGYRYIKLHEVGLEEIRAAVEAAGDKAKVMLDTNCPWTVEQALAMSKDLSDLNLYWLEEPVWPPENYRGLAIVKAQGIHRIASGGRHRHRATGRRQDRWCVRGAQNRGALRGTRHRIRSPLRVVRPRAGCDHSSQCGVSHDAAPREVVL